MTTLWLAILLSLAGPAQDAATGDGIAVAKRLVAAINGESEFQSSDFEKPLRDADKAALRRFATCKVERINYTLNFHPKRRNVLVRNFDHVSVGFGCRGVPSDTPVAISLHLKDGNIAKIETHNADLMRME